MNKLLFLTTALVAQCTISAIDNNKSIELADTAYKLFLELAWEARDIGTLPEDTPAFAKQTALKLTPEYKELKNALEASFEAKNLSKAKKVAKPVIAFAQALQAKLNNLKQGLADVEQLIIDQGGSIAPIDVAYFEILKQYDLQHVYLYTLGALTKQQQEIDELATRIVDLSYAVRTCAEDSELGVSLQKQALTFIQESPVVARLRQELMAANESIDDLREAAYGLPNVMLFLRLAELKSTNKTVLLKKYDNHPEVLKLCDRGLERFNEDELLRLLTYDRDNADELS